MYQNLQNYLEELFGNRYHYQEEILSFFNVSKPCINSYKRRLRQTYEGSEYDMLKNIDKNATIVSIRIYKQLWIEDHYIFYMEVLLLDGEGEARPMKRYSVIFK